MLKQISTPTILSEETELRGRFSFFSKTVVLGRIEGEIILEEKEPLHLAQSSWITGKVASQGTITVEGRIEGEIFSSEEIILMPSSIVLGTMAAPRIRIEPGAFFYGKIQMEGQKNLLEKEFLQKREDETQQEAA